jgi:predicted  nucleic acid-binding Zn-ribbon protein
MPTSLDPQPGENELECARCGAIFSDELTRCPKCGVNLYEPEAEAPPRRKPADEQAWGAKVSRFFRRLLGEPHPADELFQPALDQAAIYNDLVRKVGWDRAVAERLIDFERQQAPNQTHAQWIKNAIQRWEHDNRAD